MVLSRTFSVALGNEKFWERLFQQYRPIPAGGLPLIVMPVR